MIPLILSVLCSLPCALHPSLTPPFAPLRCAPRYTYILRCSHALHLDCYNGMVEQGNYSCPLCKKSVADMSELWERFDEAVEAQPMPEEWSGKMANVTCHDCEERSRADFHFLGLKCKHCGSYNTAQVGGDDDGDGDGDNDDKEEGGSVGDCGGGGGGAGGGGDGGDGGDGGGSGGNGGNGGNGDDDDDVEEVKAVAAEEGEGGCEGGCEGQGDRGDGGESAVVVGVQADIVVDPPSFDPAEPPDRV